MPINYLGTQLDGVRSTSQVANSFMGTGRMPVAGVLAHFSAMTTAVRKGRRVRVATLVDRSVGRVRSLTADVRVTRSGHRADFGCDQTGPGCGTWTRWEIVETRPKPAELEALDVTAYKDGRNGEVKKIKKSKKSKEKSENRDGYDERGTDTAG